MVASFFLLFYLHYFPSLHPYEYQIFKETLHTHPSECYCTLTLDQFLSFFLILSQVLQLVAVHTYTVSTEPLCISYHLLFPDLWIFKIKTFCQVYLTYLSHGKCQILDANLCETALLINPSVPSLLISLNLSKNFIYHTQQTSTSIAAAFIYITFSFILYILHMLPVERNQERHKNMQWVAQSVMLP